MDLIKCKMTCESCSTVKKLLEKGVWLHKGTGTLTDVEYQPVDLNDLNLGNLKKVTDVFNPITDIGTDRKPYGCIWFSAGSWAFDPYNDFTCDDHGPISGNFLAIENPKNILHVKTLEEFTDFHEMYGNMIIDHKTMMRKHTLSTRKTFCGENFDPLVTLKKFSDHCNIDFKKVVEIFDSCIATEDKNVQKMIEMFSDEFGVSQDTFQSDRFVLELCAIAKQYTLIKDIPDTFVLDRGTLNWQSVKDAGYYGVAFHFKDLYDAFGTNMTTWHDGFDVESLVVWDLRAFDNEVTPICVD